MFLSRLSRPMKTFLSHTAQRWPSCVPAPHVLLRIVLSVTLLASTGGVLLRIVAGATLLASVSGTASASARGFYVDGTSMAPTLYSGQVLLVNKAWAWRLDQTPMEQVLPHSPAASPPYLFSGPQRRDVVVFLSPINDGRYLVKRLIGLPGEVVRVKAGRVSINGTLLDEPYVKFVDDYDYPSGDNSGRVPDNAYFVLGDNRPASGDSHYGWWVPAENLVGKAMYPLPQGWLPYWSMPQTDTNREGAPRPKANGP